MLTAILYRFDTAALAAIVRALLLATGLIVTVCVVAAYAPLVLSFCSAVVWPCVCNAGAVAMVLGSVFAIMKFLMR